MTDATSTQQDTSDARKIQRRIARIMHRLDWAKPDASDDEINAAFEAERSAYMKKASKLQSRLGKRGVEMSLSAE